MRIVPGYENFNSGMTSGTSIKVGEGGQGVAFTSFQQPMTHELLGVGFNIPIHI